MKILHITAIGSEVQKSGVPSVLSNLCFEQNKIEGVESRVLSVRTEKGKVDNSFDTLKNQSIEDYLKVYKPDLAIIHTVFFIQYVRVVRSLIKLNIPFFVEPHGSFGKMALKKSFFKKKIALNTLLRPLIRQSKAFIFTNSAEQKDAIIHKKYELVIPNGVAQPILSEETSSKTVNDESPIFYYLGRYKIHHKGLDYLMKALRILDEKRETISVRFYGLGDNAEMEYMTREISRFKYIDVKEMGTLFGAEKVDVLSKANILLLTSRYEGSPITILDSLTFGNPCVVTPGTNVADEIAMNNLGWKTELDAQCIANSIIRAKNEYIEDIAGYETRCKNYVVDNYLWSKIADYSIKEYSKIISI